MKRVIILVFLIQLPIFHWAYSQSKKNGEDGVFINPIFSGDYPDPSILRNGNDYYIVHSSFEYYPGLLIWHSNDLINWKPVVHALKQYVGSVYAPDLIKSHDKYYIYFPAGGTNYVVWANSIEGPWSDPIDLKIGNIDPGHISDDDGKRYLYFNDGTYVPLSDDGLSVVEKPKHAYSGWPIPREWIIECFCLEGPKLIKRGQYYYLTVAEGGTAGPATSHLIASARSKSPLGPWENSPYNPIIRTSSSAERWWSKGHGTIIDDASGNWWMVFHAYEKGFHTMGRQTLLQPLEWTEDGWFKTPDGVDTEKPLKTPLNAEPKSKISLSDNFSAPSLGLQWHFYKEYNTERFKLEDNSLIIDAKGGSVGDSSPLLMVPQDHSYNVQVELELEGDALGGLVLFYDERSYSGIAVSKDHIFSILRTWQNPSEKNLTGNHIFLRLQSRNHLVNMYYSSDGVNWNKVESSLEMSGFHHNVLGGFMSLRVGLSAIGTGKVRFKNFIYEPVQ